MVSGEAGSRDRFIVVVVIRKSWRRSGSLAVEVEAEPACVQGRLGLGGAAWEVNLPLQREGACATGLLEATGRAAHL